LTFLSITYYKNVKDNEINRMTDCNNKLANEIEVNNKIKESINENLK